MKFAIRLYICFILAAAVSPGCTKATAKFPDTTPAEVATRYFKLLADGGRLSNQEAYKMVSTKYGEISADSFRKWTENYGSTPSKVRVVSTALPKEPNKNGDWVAAVKLEVSAPSKFDDNFKTTSQINLILDKASNEWQIDFNAETIDESAFMKAPQNADGSALATQNADGAALATK